MQTDTKPAAYSRKRRLCPFWDRILHKGGFPPVVLALSSIWRAFTS